MENQLWYFGHISRVDAEEILKTSEGAVQLIRESSIPGCYALSQWEPKTNRFFHILISPLADQGYTMEDCPDTNVYRSVEEILTTSTECQGFGFFTNKQSKLVTEGPLGGHRRPSQAVPKIPQGIDFIAQYPGFRIEPLRAVASAERKLMFQPCHYRIWFFHSPHLNYVGTINRKHSEEKFEPVVVSVLPGEQSARIIVRSRLGDHQLIHQLGDNKKVKWKKGLPSTVKAAVAAEIQKLRGDSKPLHLSLDYVKHDQELLTKLLRFETGDPLRAKCFNIGVVYSKEGQTTEEEAFNNRDGSPLFNEFLQFLGDKIPLKGWKGYRGDLDIKTDSSGTHSIYRRWKGYELMFHVSTMLTYTPGAEQQIHRKRRIGNDVGVIVFQEGGTYHPPIQSQFLRKISSVIFSLRLLFCGLADLQRKITTSISSWRDDSGRRGRLWTKRHFRSVFSQSKLFGFVVNQSDERIVSIAESSFTARESLVSSQRTFPARISHRTHQIQIDLVSTFFQLKLQMLYNKTSVVAT